MIGGGGRRLRIVHVIESLGLGGAEVLLSEGLPRLAQLGHEVRVFALAEPSTLRTTLTEAGVPTQVLLDTPFAKSKIPRAVARLRSALQRSSADVVHSHLFHASVVARIATLSLGASRPRLVTSLHNPDYRGLALEGIDPRKIALQAAIDWSSTMIANDALLAVSGAVARDYEARLGRRGPYGRTRVVHNAIDVAALASTADAIDVAAARASWGVAPGQLLVVSVGRLAFQKNYALLSDTVRRVRASGLDVVALILGDGPEGDTLRAAAPEGVRFVGAQPRARVIEALVACDVYAQTSRYEAFGIAILEAMAARRPVVATDVDGIAEVVADRVTGRLVPSGDDDALATALADLVRDRELRNAYGDAGRQRATELFDMRGWVAATEAVYRGLARGRHHHV